MRYPMPFISANEKVKYSVSLQSLLVCFGGAFDFVWVMAIEVYKLDGSVNFLESKLDNCQLSIPHIATCLLIFQSVDLLKLSS